MIKMIRYWSKMLTSINTHSKNSIIKMNETNEKINLLETRVNDIFTEIKKKNMIEIKKKNMIEKKMTIIYILNKENIEEMLKIIEYNEKNFDIETILYKNKDVKYENNKYKILEGEATFKNILEITNNNYFLFINDITYFPLDFQYQLNRISIENNIIFCDCELVNTENNELKKQKKFSFPGRIKIENIDALKNWDKTDLSNIIFKINFEYHNKIDDFDIKKAMDEETFFKMMHNSLYLDQKKKIILTKNILFKSNLQLPKVKTINIKYVYELEKILIYYNEKKIIEKNVMKSFLIAYLAKNIKTFEKEKILLSKDMIERRNIIIGRILNELNIEYVEKNFFYFWKKYQIGFNYMFFEKKSKKSRAGVYLINEGNDYLKLKLIYNEDKWDIYIKEKKYKLSEFENKTVFEYFNEKKFVKNTYIKLNCSVAEFSKITFDGTEQIVRNFNKRIKEKKYINENSKLLFFDRVNKADDNAEKLYEFFHKEKKYTNCEFVISKSSPDWNRLLKKKYKLIDYASQEFEMKYKNSDFIFSSSVNPTEIENFKNLRNSENICKAKFIFLQHGIITDDMRSFFKDKKIDMFVLGAKYEYENFSKKYTFFASELAYSGLPRYDNYQEIKINKDIVFHFTWRRNLKNVSLKDFEDSEYYKGIKKILSDENLKKTLYEKKYQIKYIIHPEISDEYHQLFLKLENENIKIKLANEINYNQIIRESVALVTDYSSIFTDFAFCNKKILYFQKNKNSFFQQHTYKEEMNYEKEGLGNVYDSEKGFLLGLDLEIKKNFHVSEVDKKKTKEFFGFTESNACEKLYEIITKKYSVEDKSNIQ